MQATQITLRNVRQSPSFARRIREKCEALERVYPGLRHCRVCVERPMNAPQEPFVVTLRLGMPDGEIVVREKHPLDAHLAVREAFSAARRQLKAAISPAPREGGGDVER